MRQATIKREKVKFIGRLISYHCFLNVDYREFKHFLFEEGDDEHETVGGFWTRMHERFFNDSSVKMFCVANGRIIKIEITEQQNELFVVAFTGTGPSISNQQIIGSSHLDVSFSIETDYNWKKGTMLTLYTV